MLSEVKVKVRLRGIQGNAVDGKEGLMALGMFEVLDDNNKPAPQSVAQIGLNAEMLESLGPKILQTGEMTITFK